MTDEEVIKTRNDLEMMKRQHLWTYIFLPLINRKLKTQNDQLGVEGLLFCHGKQGDRFIFFERQNMFMSIPEGARFEKGGIEMLRRLVNEGWQVD